MVFYRESFFRRPERELERKEAQQEQEKKVEELVSFLEKIASKLKSEGVPVTEDVRIDMSAFEGIYSREEVKRDMQLVAERDSKRYPGRSGEEIRKERLKNDGERLEMLKTAIFTKGLGDQFVVVRASRYDDEKGVDNIILDKETSDIICALDEVADVGSERYHKKVETVLSRNRRREGGGATLKYGFFIGKEKAGGTKLSFGRVENIPLFYLALRKQYLEEGIGNFTPELSKISEYEKKLFSYFVSTILNQIDSLKLERDLPKPLRDRIDRFDELFSPFRYREGPN